MALKRGTDPFCPRGSPWGVHAWIWRLGLIACDPRLMRHQATLPFRHLILSCERIARCFRRMSRCFFGEGNWEACWLGLFADANDWQATAFYAKLDFHGRSRSSFQLSLQN